MAPRRVYWLAPWGGSRAEAGACGLDRARITVRRNRVPVSGGVVVETSTKTNRVRVVDLDAETVRVLRAHHDAQRSATVVLLQDSNNYVFVDDHGEPLNPNSISYRFRRAVKQSGLRHVPLRGPRHSHVTELLEAGVSIHEVAARAGHSKPTTTLNIYAHLLHSQEASVAALTSSVKPVE